MRKLRLGELLSKETTQFHSSTSLLASDLKFHEGSISLWLRNPKYDKEVMGDLVEVWAVPEIPGLDPVVALRKYLQLRHDKFGKSADYPLFLHEDGSIFTKQQMNKDLKALLADYPELCTSLNQWTGHCFRSGLSTLLAILGFEDDQIQAWGRWRSTAFQRYLKNKEYRRKIRGGLTSTFVKIRGMIS